MWELMLVIARGMHIAAGVLAAFVVFPAQAINRKGGIWHRRLGRSAIGLSVVIAATGFAMLVNPLFASFWAKEAEILGWSGFFHETFYEPAFFLWLDVILLYLVFSGYRVWSRLQATQHRHVLSASAIDYGLTTLVALFSLFFLVVGLIDLIRVDAYGGYLVITAVLLLLFVGWTSAPSRDRQPIVAGGCPTPFACS